MPTMKAMMTRAAEALTEMAALVESAARQPLSWWVPDAESAGPDGGGPARLDPPLHHCVEGSHPLHVAEWGTVEGPAALLVHGFTGNSGDWASIVPILVDGGYRVLAVDLPGHGRSGGGSGTRINIERLADEVAVVIEQLDLSDLVLVGHSLGGSVVLALASHHHELAVARVRHVVSVSATTAIRRPPEVATMLLGGHPASAFILSDRVAGRTSMQLVAFASGASTALLDDMRLRWAACPIPVRMTYAVGLVGGDIRPLLPDVPVAVTAVAGTLDRMCPPSRARAIADGVPVGGLRLVPGAGHAVLTERPEEIAAAILGAPFPAGV